MSEATEYRANLTVCRQMADKAPNEQDKRAWLDLAESWRLLIVAGHQDIDREELTAAPDGQRMALTGLFRLTRGLVRPVEMLAPLLSETFSELARHAEVSSRNSPVDAQSWAARTPIQI
jgi:hypothetical protein